MIRTYLPNFIIAGVNKAGTTSVFQYLNGHPQVCGSLDKETGYFLPLRYGMALKPIQIYEQQFHKGNIKKIITEATPGYFYGGIQLATGIINTVKNDCKVLIILREPVSRLFSFYRAKKKSLELDRSMDFKSYVQACLNMNQDQLGIQENNKYTGVSCGFYSNHIKDWFDVFGTNLKLLFYDDLSDDPKKFMKELCQWLQIDESYFDQFKFEIENKTYTFKNKEIQKMAVTLNANAARFWRKNPGVKKWIRKQYFKFNSSQKSELIDNETLGRVAHIYQPYNLQLKSLLTQEGITHFPDWLNNK
jgi:hypothetical protein